MVASLVINSRSRRRSSVTSRSRTSEPMRVPLGLSGMARNWMTPSAPSTSNSRGAQPLATLDQRLVHRPAGRGEFGGGLAEVVADEVGGEAEPVVGGQRVGAGVLDDAVGVEPDQPVADPRRGVHVDLLAGEGEGAGGDHLGQVGGALEVGELQPARGADGEQVGVAGDDPEDPALPAHRDGLDPHRHLLAPLRVALAHDPALVERGVQQRAAAARDEVADHVVLVRGRAGVRAASGRPRRSGCRRGWGPTGRGRRRRGRRAAATPRPAGGATRGRSHSRAVCWRTSSFMEGTCASVPAGSDMAGNRGWRKGSKRPGNTRGPRRLRGTLSPLGTAARSSNGRGVCGPGGRWMRSRRSQGREPRFLDPSSCAGKTEALVVHTVDRACASLRIVD